MLVQGLYLTVSDGKAAARTTDWTSLSCNESRWTRGTQQVSRVASLVNYLQTLSCYVWFDILTAVVMKSSICWDTTPCSPLKANRRFGGICRLHIQDQRINQARNQHRSWWQADGYGNVGWLSKDYTALYPKSESSSISFYGNIHNVRQQDSIFSQVSLQTTFIIKQNRHTVSTLVFYFAWDVILLHVSTLLLGHCIAYAWRGPNKRVETCSGITSHAK
jgi:hypothetical protein